MDDREMTDVKVSQSWVNKIKEKVFRLFRITSRPVVKVYNGYGNADELVVFGHVLSLSPLPRKTYRQNFWTNSLALLRMFMVRPKACVPLELRFDDQVIVGESEKDGFFRFQWKPASMPAPGVHPVEVFINAERVRRHHGAVSGKGKILVPFPGPFAFVSDIDDTFLISYSNNLRKRLFVLLTENAYSRKPFEGVVKHYQSLEMAGPHTIHGNPFFYVSSSEWNLYDYICDFSKRNALPEGILLLNQMKRFSQIWKTGQSNHGTKFMRISRVIQAFPDRRFVLLGDDSQQDPMIYAAIVDYFPGRVQAVYLRNIVKKQRPDVVNAIARLEAAGAPVCHFRHSRDAIEHSRKAGLLRAPAAGDPDGSVG